MQILPYNIEGYKLLHDGMLSFSEMQQNGINIDTVHLKSEFKRLGKEIKESLLFLDKFKEVQLWKKKYKDKFTIDSDEQLADILFEEMGHEASKKTATGNPSVDQEALTNLDLPLTNELLKYRKLYKLQNTYLKGLIKETCNGMIHPFMNLHTARSFRSSSSLPNVQNMPTRDPVAGKIIRKAFIARKDHYLFCADYGGVEVKAAQLYHQDPTMRNYLNDPLHADMHSDFACLLFLLDEIDQDVEGEKLLRACTKNSFTFPQFYGDYYKNNALGIWKWLKFSGEKIKRNEGPIIKTGITIGQHLINNKIKTFNQFVEHVKVIEKNMWKVRFPVYDKWKETQYRSYLKNGYITSLSGFVYSGILEKNAVVNYPIQGLAFHFLLWSCIQLTKYHLTKNKMKSKPIFQVHDELIVDVHKDEYDDVIELLKQVMVHDLKDHWKFIDIPLELEIEASELNGNWFETKKILHYIY